MPRFFFDVTQDGELTADYEGHELPSSSRARAEAVQAVQEISSELASATKHHTVSVAVLNVDHHVICTPKISFDLGESDT